MIFKWNSRNHSNLLKLITKKTASNPVINGVIEGNNLGSIYVNDRKLPTSAFIWAKNEMFFLIGNATNTDFNLAVYDLLTKKIAKQALSAGEENLNLELYPYSEWKQVINNFAFNWRTGERVPFVFNKKSFYTFYQQQQNEIPNGYTVTKITNEVFLLDKENILRFEILKFWNSIEMFLKTGSGFCVIDNYNQLIGTCITVFVCNKDFEIGINIYDKKHRGKGLATKMAVETIANIIDQGGIPHWTTEDFRKDSITIAKKIGFKQLPNYSVYYIPFDELIDLE